MDESKSKGSARKTLRTVFHEHREKRQAEERIRIREGAKAAMTYMGEVLDYQGPIMIEEVQLDDQGSAWHQKPPRLVHRGYLGNPGLMDSDCSSPGDKQCL